MAGGKKESVVLNYLNSNTKHQTRTNSGSQEVIVVSFFVIFFFFFFRFKFCVQYPHK